MIRAILSLLFFIQFSALATSELPALIPLPQSLQWLPDQFSILSCRSIIINDSALQQVTGNVQTIIGRTLPIRQSDDVQDESTIMLEIGKVEASAVPDEAYHLVVRNHAVRLTANTPKGIFYGLQTLSQLIIRKHFLQGCEITDHPAFSWRGFMIDVGRNYQSPELLKQQIDIMARYKLNVFHFHLTEDVAWRLQLKGYPQLTAPEHMQRDKGKFYSIDEMKDLISYCRDRYITLVPEIDMPGHSKAFTRAVGTDMQTDTGLQIVKSIVAEIAHTYDLAFLHIGADEVELKNKDFLPSVIEQIQKNDVRVIAWSPGGNYNDQTIRQLWTDEGEKDIRKAGVKYIDSRLLYLSDMEPESAVVSIFNRQLGEKTKGDETLLGAEICLWDDRKMALEEDHLRMNPVYPAMVTFSERSWRGGGYPNVYYTIGSDSLQRAKDFVAFEKRLIEHKNKYFQQSWFPYVRQSFIKWKLFGPFENAGDIERSFPPEQGRKSLSGSSAVVEATGGTIWLWHSFAPVAKGWLDSPRVNTTWYAYTRFWSDAETNMQFWIELKNLSRSGADATPPAGHWDYFQSKVWLNHKEVAPPRWAQAGLPSGKLESPLIDEGYSYRAPVRAAVKKGWNEVLIKLPLNEFDPSKDWQVPPKWMFTFIPVRRDKKENWSALELNFQP